MEVINNKEFDCILSDYQMPKMNGLELLKNLNGKDVDIPFIFITGQGNEEVAAEALREGADGYFRKGPDFVYYERLLASIVKVVDAKNHKASYVQAVEALRENEHFLRLIIDNAPQVVFFKGVDGDYKLANRNFEKAISMTEEEVLGKTDHEIYPENVADQILENDALVMSEGKPTYLKEAVVLKGEEFLYESIKLPVSDSKGRPLGLLGLSTDITEREAAKDALREKEQNYQDIFNSSSDSIFIHDAETGEIEDVNLIVLKTYGYDSLEEIQRCSITDLSVGEAPYTDAEALQYLKKARQEGKQTFQWRCRRKDGTLFWSENTLQRTIVGGRSKIIATVRDITEQKKQYDALGKSEEHYRMVVDAFDAAVFLVKDGKGYFQNLRLFEMTGYSKSEFENMSVFDTVHPDDRERALKYHADRMAGKSDVPSRYKLRLLTKSGSEINVEVNANLIDWEGEKVTHVVLRLVK
jgi:PAS domain S-box-containing protein